MDKQTKIKLAVCMAVSIPIALSIHFNFKNRFFRYCKASEAACNCMYDMATKLELEDAYSKVMETGEAYYLNNELANRSDEFVRKAEIMLINCQNVK